MDENKTKIRLTANMSLFLIREFMQSADYPPDMTWAGLQDASMQGFVQWAQREYNMQLYIQDGIIYVNFLDSKQAIEFILKHG